MKITCEACGGRVKVVKSAVVAELGADLGLAAAAYLGVLTGGMGLAAMGPALLMRKKLFESVKKANGGFFQCSRCRKEASNMRVLSEIIK